VVLNKSVHSHCENSD